MGGRRDISKFAELGGFPNQEFLDENGEDKMARESN